MPKASFTPFQPHNPTFSACLAICEKEMPAFSGSTCYRSPNNIQGCPSRGALKFLLDGLVLWCSACFCCFVTSCTSRVCRSWLKLCPEPPSLCSDVELQADQMVVVTDRCESQRVGNWDDSGTWLWNPQMDDSNHGFSPGHRGWRECTMAWDILILNW